MGTTACSLGTSSGERGGYFLKRGARERWILSFKESTDSLTHAHSTAANFIEGYAVHPSGEGRLEAAAERSLGDLKRLVTGREQFAFPSAVNTATVANVLAECSPPPVC